MTWRTRPDGCCWTCGAAGGEADSLRREGDRQSHEFIAAQLAAARPGDAVLSEEGRDDPARLAADRVWIVDPLDGTREFGEPGRSDWAVHVALWERGELTAGAVALPAQGRVLSTAALALDATARPPAARPGRRDPRPGPTASSGSWSAAPGRPSSCSGWPGRYRRRLLPLGSAGAKAAAVINGDADAYVHSGGQYEWDSAAPVAVARAAGLHTSRIDGSKLVYNPAEPSVPDILICRAALAGMLLEAIGYVRYPRE